jgi:hypothetical protein
VVSSHDDDSADDGGHCEKHKDGIETRDPMLIQAETYKRERGIEVQN